MGVVAVEGREPFEVCPNPKKQRPPPGTTLQWIRRSEYPNPVPDVKGSPLLELNSVSLCGPKLSAIIRRSGGGPFHVWGRIILTDDLGNLFTLFTRKKIDPLLIEPTSIDSMAYDINIGRDKLGGPRCLPCKFSLKFHLLLQVYGHPPLRFDEISPLIDCTSNVLYDELQEAYAGRKSGIEAFFEFTMHRCSVLAHTGFVIEDKTKPEPRPKYETEEEDEHDCDCDSASVDVSGQIYAVYQNSCSNKPMLFNFEAGHSSLELGNFIRGPTLAVPAYSTFSFEFARFYVQQELIDDCTSTLEFDTPVLWGYKYEKQIHGQKYLIRFILSWDIPMNVLPERICQYHVDDKSIVPEQKYKRRKATYCQPIYIQPHLESLDETRWWISVGLCQEAVEIFSIYICAYNKPINGNQPLNLKGSTFVSDLEKELVVCKGVTLLDSGDKLLYPQGIDRCFMGGHFCIDIKYEDEDDDDGGGHELFCHGCAAYNQYNVGRWFNRRICSVIKGINGYAALHYTIFGDAVQAKLRFELSPCSPSSGYCRVKGRISTGYDNFRYSTDYEKKYYRSILFENLDEGLIVEGGNNEIPLLKSAVAVPLAASLVVELDIVLKHAEEEEEEETFSSKASFSSPMVVYEIKRSKKVSQPPFRIPGKHASLLVHLEWACVGY